LNYYLHHIGDFKKDTNFLNHEQRSIYLELLWLYYDQEKPLIKDIHLLAMKVQATNEQVQSILKLFFTEEEDCYTHRRIDEELEKMYERSEKAREKAYKRWNSNATAKPQQSNSNANGMQPNTHNPKPKTQVFSEAFKKFWDSYPNKVKKDYSYGIWKKQNLDGEVDKIIKHLESIKQSKDWKQGFVQHPSTYLNQKMYLDDVVTVPQIKGRVL